MTRKPSDAQARLIIIVLIAQLLLMVEATAGQIHDVAQDGDAAAVEHLLRSGIDVSEKEERSGRMPLHLAARYGHLTVAKLLLDEGANVDAMDKLEKTPLWEAAWEGQTAVAKLLIERGAGVNNSDSSGRTPLHGAAAKRRFDMVELLIRNGADLNARNDDGNTPLLYGFHGDPKQVEAYSAIAELLISAGADIDSKGRGGSTALHYAATWGFYRVTRLLIEKGADLDARDGVGRTPLHSAAQGGDIRLVRLLLEKGADVNAAAKDGRSPLNLAFQSQHRDIVNLLRERGAEKSRFCTTVADIKKMNRGGIRRLFTLRGIDAKIFLALDPRLLNYPEALELLLEQDVDEIIAWRLKQLQTLGAAIPFSEGCAVDGYGEPDMIDKIKLMEDILRLIKRHGPNDKRVRLRIEGLWEYEAPLPQSDLEAQIDALLDRVRSLLAAEG